MRYRIGIDEAGRGPLAGPVAVGVVCATIEGQKLLPKKLKDSKKLSEEEREAWFRKLKSWKKEGQVMYAVSLVSSALIDKRGIVYAIRLGIKRSLRKVAADPLFSEVLLDGGLRAPALFRKQQTIIRGDEKIPLIALASIAAKVTRDEHMKKMDQKLPQYNFGVHKGYGTKLHRSLIERHGISPIHRRSFLRRLPLAEEI